MARGGAREGAGRKRSVQPPQVEFPVNKRLEVSMRPVADLVPAARNARTHSDAQVDVICASLKEFGWTNPVLIGGKNGIVAGHGRVLAARKLGMTEVPVIELGHLTAVQRRAYLIADNQTALRAGWDLAVLKLELTELQAGGFDLAPLGFDPIELGALLGTGANVGLTDPDAVPEAPEIPVATSGDLWALGRHWLLCGDATETAAVQRLLNGAKPQLCITDPPYGLGDTKSKKNKYSGYDDTKVSLIEIAAKFLPIAREVAMTVVMTPGNGNQRIYPAPSWTMAWFTPAGVGRGPWGFCCWQPILCYGKDPKLAHGQGCHPDALVHTESAEDFGHPCTKPIKLWSWLMDRTANDAANVYDPFVGSGTTIIAAEMTGRSCHAIELNPAYVDVCIKRWQAFTGLKATLHGDGREFDMVAAERTALKAA